MKTKSTETISVSRRGDVNTWVYDVLRYLIAAYLLWMIVKEFRAGQLLENVSYFEASRDDRPVVFWLVIATQFIVAACFAVFRDVWSW